MKLLFVCNENTYDHFFRPHVIEMRKKGYDCIVHTIDKNDPGSLKSRRGIVTLPRQFWQLIKDMLVHKPECIVSITPKAGFICSIISKLFWTRHIHWFTGQVWCLDTGVMRILRSIPDRITNLLSSEQLVDSRPQLKYLKNAGFFAQKMITLGMGSITGVPVVRPFSNPDSIGESTLRIGIVGRICKDKGINDILDYIENDFDNRLGTKFIFFGNIEDGEIELSHRFNQLCKKIPDRLCYLGVAGNKKDIYSSFDILLLASYREGFSNVLIEAQSYGRPVIVRKIYAVEDSFSAGNSGYYFTDNQSLEYAIMKLSDRTNFQSQSEFAVDYVRENFDQENVVKLICDKYES